MNSLPEPPARGILQGLAFNGPVISGSSLIFEALKTTTSECR
jgi:hypothetical protein